MSQEMLWLSVLLITTQAISYGALLRVVFLLKNIGKCPIEKMQKSKDCTVRNSGEEDEDLKSKYLEYINSFEVEV